MVAQQPQISSHAAICSNRNSLAGTIRTRATAPTRAASRATRSNQATRVASTRGAASRPRATPRGFSSRLRGNPLPALLRAAPSRSLATPRVECCALPSRSCAVGRPSWPLHKKSYAQYVPYLCAASHPTARASVVGRTCESMGRVLLAVQWLSLSAGSLYPQVTSLLPPTQFCS